MRQQQHYRHRYKLSLVEKIALRQIRASQLRAKMSLGWFKWCGSSVSVTTAYFLFTNMLTRSALFAAGGGGGGGDGDDNSQQIMWLIFLILIVWLTFVAFVRDYRLSRQLARLRLGSTEFDLKYALLVLDSVR